jgi:hypothetical protein
MRIRTLWPAAVLIGLAAGCKDTLNVQPTSEVPTEKAIVDANSARAALAGAYAALDSGSYYGGEMVFFGDLPSEDVAHSGTYSSYADLDALRWRADNTGIRDVWAAVYQAINWANELIVRIPGVPGLSSSEKNDIVGQAYFLRALSYHNLVKFWGGVPLRLQPAASVGQASTIARSDTGAVYAQILKDLDQAGTLISNTTNTRQATVGAVAALRSRVLLYRGDWAGTIQAANKVIAMGYTLAPNFSDLFTPQGQNTPEDIFRVAFTAKDYNLIGYYYLSKEFGGRRELSPTRALLDAYGYNADVNYRSDTLQIFDTAGTLILKPADARAAWSISYDSRGRRYGKKYPTAIGAEHVHVIRFAEVLLNKAEAEARLGQLDSAVAVVNVVRARAGIYQRVLGVDVKTQQDVIGAVLEERRLELAMEGFRWPDEIRTGRAAALLAAKGRPAYMTLFPIPQQELDVSPNVTQNPGY